ncbi:MAG: NAD(P)/FAD-dependent oxidoreductase [Gemmatimonadota bacterium]|nr:NAD(P)/FAD-dependent oxidoreductase [Gemmatimonadota bacterium]
MDLDLVVIGAGTGGMGVARMCASAGWKVAIIDSEPYGGTCALRGCDPKKMLVGVTESLDLAMRMNDKGLMADDLGIDWTRLMAFKRTFTDPTPERAARGLRKLGVETLRGTARFVGTRELDVDGRRLAPRFIHVATGARPATLGIPGEDLLTTSTGFLELEALPPRIAFVGGGFISFEFAHIARRAGAREVTILHRGPRPLAHFDPDLVDLVIRRSRELGIDVRLEHCVDGVERGPAGLRVAVSTPAGPTNVDLDLVVHGAGRVPAIDELDLPAAGVDAGDLGIRVHESMRSVSNAAVFAAGDCADTGAPPLTPVSAFEARVAAKNLLAGRDERRVAYPPIPSVLFTIPPLAKVGLLEQEAAAQGLEVEVHHRETAGWYSSLRVAETCTAFKVLVEKQTRRVVGAHLLGPGAEEQVNVLAAAMAAGADANHIKGMVFAYPSYASDLASMV